MFSVKTYSYNQHDVVPLAVMANNGPATLNGAIGAPTAPITGLVTLANVTLLTGTTRAVDVC
jgi:hypothetical protein